MVVKKENDNNYITTNYNNCACKFIQHVNKRTVCKMVVLSNSFQILSKLNIFQFLPYLLNKQFDAIRGRKIHQATQNEAFNFRKVRFKRICMNANFCGRIFQPPLFLLVQSCGLELRIRFLSIYSCYNNPHSKFKPANTPLRATKSGLLWLGSFIKPT